ncbi:hypothetical protein [Bradyrhizobium lablabi]|uniref:hypothetical protein n=1 Tax=Bradyrhizobium lablabi TaxID=722472 RepID=UPI001BA86ED9|nr:hypothetical protein [Bradyrhizobium lablabi]MBR0693063.1 hypothetical protein [Bradyrhizobium lablabi]
MDDALSKRLEAVLERKKTVDEELENKAKQFANAQADTKRRLTEVLQQWARAKEWISDARKSVNGKLHGHGLQFDADVNEDDPAVARVTLTLQGGDPIRAKQLQLNISAFGKGQVSYPNSSVIKEFELAKVTPEFFEELMIELLEGTYPDQK